MNEAVVMRGKTSKKRFFIALLAGFLFLAGLLTTFGITGVAVAAPIAGLGKFNVAFTEMNGQGFKLYGDLYGNPKDGPKGVAPVFVNEIDKVKIKDLVISKVVEIPMLGSYTVKISAGKGSTPVEITGLQQKAALIQGDAVFKEMDISEHYVTPDENDPGKVARESFTQGAKAITIKNGSLDTRYLFQELVTLPGLKVEFIRN